MGLRFGLLGAGRIGTVHAAAVARTSGAYASPSAAFIDTLNAGRPMIPSGGDGLKALLAADTALKPLTERREVEIVY